jgi:hypothetical protein
MTIAAMVGRTGVPRADDPVWLHLDGWAAELDLTAPAAVARVSEPPGGRDTERDLGAGGPDMTHTAGPASGNGFPGLSGWRALTVSFPAARSSFFFPVFPLLSSGLTAAPGLICPC